MHWLLTEGGSSLCESIKTGANALMIAMNNCRFRAAQYLLEGNAGPALMAVRNKYFNKTWRCMRSNLIGGDGAVELSSLIKLMVMLEDAPAHVISSMSLKNADICTRGLLLRVQLPSYLEQQRAAVVTHCPLPDVLRSLVAEYAATTPEDMWADGLRVQVTRAKRARRNVEKEEDDDGEDAPPLRRSLRLRQKRA
jgi:hypothetical protein